MLAPILVRFLRPAYVVAGGFALTAAGLALLAQIEAGSSVALVVIASVIIALGVTPAVTLGTDLVVSSVPPERAGVASGISETGAELGGALGIAALGSIGVAVYRSQIADAVPDGVPPEASETAKDTLGGATQAVEGLPGALGETLLDAAQEAFTQGFQVAAVAGAAVAITMAIISALLLPRIGQGAPHEEPVAAASEAAFEAPPS
jgi:DHA2 family multidrug resistance protein-like MFS transporter